MSEEKPQSTAPNFDQLEQEVLKFWDENHIFEKSLEQTKHGTPYIFYDGPPFATGLPHYGHILGSAVKDAFGRYQTMKGHFVRRRWGWDCHGLPIENIVEQNLKISGKKQIEEVGVERFNRICRENVLRFAEEWGKMVRRMGRWVDFQNSYKTMDTTYMESVWWGLKQIWDKGLIYEDRKVLLYCSRCETPISNFEVAMDNSYRDVTEESVFAKFKMLPRQRIVNDLTNDKTYALAWTTTPWTLPGNTSLNIGPDITYVMVEMDSGERYILAKDRLSVLSEPYELVSEYPARSLEGLMYEPLYPGVIRDPNNRAHKIYQASFVTTTDGTGIVHNAAMYGEEDYQLAKEKGLPRVDMLDHKGQYLEMAPEHLRGVFFKDADKIILKELKEKGLVYKTMAYRHSYPHCYRCGTPLFYNALPAWFINIQQVKPRLRQLNNQEINWYPAHLKEGRFDKSMESAPDWNISRNRYWATALPFWKCDTKECGNVTCVGSVAELKEKATNFSQIYPNYGLRITDSGATGSVAELDLHRPYIDQVVLKCGKCGGEMHRIPEVVDCWVESASMPFAELHFPFENNADRNAEQSLMSTAAADGSLNDMNLSGIMGGSDVAPTTPADVQHHSASDSAPFRGVEDFQHRFPADFVAEYIAQTRAWFYVMHVVSTVIFDHAPFRNVVTTGTVLAEDGSKMSKSKNNFPDPWLLIEKFGIDAVRFYLLSSPVMNADDLNFAEKSVQEVNRKVSLLLYNSLTFLRLYTSGKFEDVKPESSNVLDRWVLARLGQTKREVTQQMDGYNTVKACRAVVDFVNDLSTWYLRRSRDRMKAETEEGKVALSTLAYALAETAKLLAPVMPFLADYIYRDVTGKESVHLAQWPAQTEHVDETLLKAMEAVREIVSVGLNARKELKLPVRQPLQSLAYSVKDGAVEVADSMYVQLILDELNVKQLNPQLLDQHTRPATAKIFTGTNLVSQFYLDTALTPELKAEGYARELERSVQDLRKRSGLKVGELVDVYYNTQEESLEEPLLNLFDRKKTYVSQISKSLEVEADFETQADIDGKGIWLGIVKI